MGYFSTERRICVIKRFFVLSIVNYSAIVVIIGPKQAAQTSFNCMAVIQAEGWRYESWDSSAFPRSTSG